MIDHKRNLIFIHIPRTGGTSVENVLSGNDWYYLEPETKHIHASRAREIYSDVWDEYTKFAIVRNPWDRLVSMRHAEWWNEDSGVPAHGKFEDFIRNLKFHQNENYTSRLYVDILDEPLDYILRFENLQNDFNNMLSDLSISSIELPVCHKSEHKPFREYYNDSAKDLVAQMCKRDIEKFNYSFY